MPESRTGQIARAGFWRRVAAAMIDCLIVMAPTLGLLLLVEPLVYPAAPPSDDELDRLTSLILAPIWLAYFSLEVISARTLGKGVMRIEICAIDGTQADGWTLFLRYATKHLGFMSIGVYGITGSLVFNLLSGTMDFLITIGCLRALGESKLTWHDLWSHTAVYRKPRAELQGFPVATPDPNPATQGPPPADIDPHVIRAIKILGGQDPLLALPHW